MVSRIFLKGLELEGETSGSEEPAWYHFGDGKVRIFSGPGPVPDDPFVADYYLKDHLGNIMVVFRDDNGDCVITTEEDPENREVVERFMYYAFGMQWGGVWRPENNPPDGAPSRYRYNGKEWHFSTGMLDYGFRYYMPEIGQFSGVDPLADQFPHVSVYNYAENEPIAHIDLWGLQKVSINDVRNSTGQITSRNVTVSANMKVLNLSSMDNYRFNNSLGRAGGVASRSFSTSFKGKVLDSPQTGMTSNEVPINVRFSLSVQQVSSLDQVSDSDFLGLIVNEVRNAVPGIDVAGRGELPGNLMIMESGHMTGSSSELLLHEFGHNLGLDFGGGNGHTGDGSGLMGEKLNGQTGVEKSALKSMYEGLPVTGQSHQVNHSNTRGRAKDFLNKHGASYDKNKAGKAGFN